MNNFQAIVAAVVLAGCVGVAIHAALDWRHQMVLRQRIFRSLSRHRDRPVRSWSTLFGLRRPVRRLLGDLSDLLELVGLGLSAGLTFERTLERVLPSMPAGFIKDEFSRFLDDLSVGRSREDALADMAQRVNEDRLRAVISIVSHSLKRGVSVGPVLFQQAEQIRALRFFEVEKRAHTAGLRLLFPLILFIFPSLFLVLLGPLVLNYVSTGQLF